MGPFREFDFRHQFRLYPVDRSQRFHAVGERTALCLQPLERLPDLLEHGLIEARAGLAYMNDLSLFVVQA